MKFCKDCKHFLNFQSRSICRQSEFHSDPNLITGEVRIGYYDCHDWRSNFYIHTNKIAENHCGEEAKFFEPKPPKPPKPPSLLTRIIDYLKR